MNVIFVARALPNALTEIDIFGSSTRNECKNSNALIAIDRFTAKIVSIVMPFENIMVKKLKFQSLLKVSD